ncbi:hypothetical protein [Hyphomonas sp.]|jgi:hypothetical protein|uniref:hypothetical protein n=1 Tax=Hyphomonas sp. TaxID=87 RepID=UPI0025C53A84|nr:hypothetical protein [Hyphomonas sp.]
MSGAKVSHVQIAAAHDGEAELVVTLSFENGGQSLVALDEFAARSLLASCAADSADGLIGASWEQVRDALVASSGRYAETQNTEH